MPDYRDKRERQSEIGQYFHGRLPGLTGIRAGSFSFFFEIESVEPFLTVWDGDFDRGKFDGTDLDTDDLNTPGAPFLPPFIGASTPHFEGIAFIDLDGMGNPDCTTEFTSTACPADDRSSPRWQRSPSIQIRSPGWMPLRVLPSPQRYFALVG